MRKVIRLKFVRKRVRMVAYTDLLGKSGALILIALIMSDFMVIKIIAEFYKILHVNGLMISNDTQSSSEDSISQSY